MRSFLPFLAYGGVSCAVYVACLVPLCTESMPLILEECLDAVDVKSCSTDLKTANACFPMMFFGIGAIIGAQLNGRLLDKLGEKRYTLLVILEIIISHILVIAYAQYWTFSLTFSSVMCFGFGV